eukprot:CAMPEP_0194053606 /NCGR_PEP_ID=MMETSP0009_2-20130614/50560_1 /TAXON_ID=210454 /ORGANISM="Grammatophora oceanica, Strain CCMP 410" /LENGTH=122 /DNA_ID=CAMNT_0038701791 /DNA_START=583 /DNA_END=948 /DNA_ORIENTATION=-
MHCSYYYYSQLSESRCHSLVDSIRAADTTREFWVSKISTFRMFSALWFHYKNTNDDDSNSNDNNDDDDDDATKTYQQHPQPPMQPQQPYGPPDMLLPLLDLAIYFGWTFIYGDCDSFFPFEW